MLAIARLLPKAPTVSLRVAVVVSAVSFLGLAMQLIFAYSQMHYLFQPLLAAFLCVEVGCLWLFKRWAVLTAVWCWGSTIVLLVFGALVNPLFWHEFPQNSQPLCWVLPSVFFVFTIVGFWAWRVLRTHAMRT